MRLLLAMSSHRIETLPIRALGYAQRRTDRHCATRLACQGDDRLGRLVDYASYMRRRLWDTDDRGHCDGTHVGGIAHCACHDSTAESSAARLTDETMHVASGFQVTWFPHLLDWQMPTPRQPVFLYCRIG
ncbi:hypothetical protein IF2G_05389 [Cordyceps javanica]|nr:hypothetical protein IF2G_05389 [Cordyceps javanica]